MARDQRAPLPTIPEVPPGPAPQPKPRANPVVKAAKQALSVGDIASAEEAGIPTELTPEQMQIVELVLNDPAIMSAIANAIGIGQRPEQVLFGG